MRAASSRFGWRRGLAFAGLLVALVSALAAFGAPVASARQAQDDTSVAPATTRSADGRSVTDGRRTLHVSVADGLNPDGQTVTVRGAGYDEQKGIYVSFCLRPPANQVPTPCGGGVDLTGGTGASAWISSNPPSYGQGLAVAYGPGGTFTATIVVGAALNETLDCRQAACVIATRNDHTRGTDRSQDLFVPVTFGEPGANPEQVDDAPAPPASSTAPTTAVAAPSTVLDANGLTVRDGTRSLTLSTATLSAGGQDVVVEGEGFDSTAGIYVALCALADDGAVDFSRCRTGSAGNSAWVSSDPPDYAADLATPYADDGSFVATLRLEPVIDASTDCRAQRCAIVTRNDDVSASRPPQQLAIPVQFTGGGAGTASGTTTASGLGTSAYKPVLLVALVVAVAVAASVPFNLRRHARRHNSMVEAG